MKREKTPFDDNATPGVVGGFWRAVGRFRRAVGGFRGFALKPPLETGDFSAPPDFDKDHSKSVTTSKINPRVPNSMI